MAGHGPLKKTKIVLSDYQFPQNVKSLMLKRTSWEIQIRVDDGVTIFDNFILHEQT